MLKIAYNLIFHFQLFRPTAMIDHVSQIKEIVEKQGINHLVFDKDDTLVPVYEFHIRDKKIHDTMRYLSNMGKFIVVTSNSVTVDEKNLPPEIRVDNGQKLFDIILTTYPKPYNGGELQDQMKIQETINPSKPHYEKSTTAVVGDRLLTDIHLANLMGWKSYLVKPLEKTTIKKHGIGVYLMRQFESFIISRSNFPRYNFNQVPKTQKKAQKTQK